MKTKFLALTMALVLSVGVSGTLAAAQSVTYTTETENGTKEVTVEVVEEESEDEDSTLPQVVAELLASTSTGTVETVDETDTNDALTPEGNLSVTDNIITEDGKQFLTVVTRGGHYFYLIIDYDDTGEYTVHFLNQVDEYDLIAILEDTDVYETDLSELFGETAVDEEEEEIDTTSAATDTEEAEMSADVEAESTISSPKSSPAYLTWLHGALILLAGGAALFLRNKQKKKAAATDPDGDFEEPYDLTEEDFSKEDALFEPDEEESL